MHLCFANLFNIPVFHLGGAAEELKDYVERGYYIGVTGFLIRKVRWSVWGSLVLPTLVHFIITTSVTTVAPTGDNRWN